ncbi:putative transporter small subunit [Marinimicrobium sp. UBA4509]|nr:putative transporter small subunit [Marinimicrobium sp. UBA4509]
METWIFGAYILVWPVLSLGVLAVLSISVVRDLRAAKREKRDLI